MYRPASLCTQGVYCAQCLGLERVLEANPSRPFESSSEIIIKNQRILSTLKKILKNVSSQPISGKNLKQLTGRGWDQKVTHIHPYYH